MPTTSPIVQTLPLASAILAVLIVYTALVLTGRRARSIVLPLIAAGFAYCFPKLYYGVRDCARACVRTRRLGRYVPTTSSQPKARGAVPAPAVSGAMPAPAGAISLFTVICNVML